MLAKAAKYEARLDALRTPSLEISLVETLPPMPTVEVEMTTDFDWLLDVTAPPSAPAMTEQSVDDLIRDLLGDAAASSQPSQATLVACESDVT